MGMKKTMLHKGCEIKEGKKSRGGREGESSHMIGQNDFIVEITAQRVVLNRLLLETR